jgi:hypothetical protein
MNMLLARHKSTGSRKNFRATSTRLFWIKVLRKKKIEANRSDAAYSDDRSGE